MKKHWIALALATVLSLPCLFAADKRTAQECLRLLNGEHEPLFFQNQVIPEYRDTAARLVEIGEAALPAIQSDLDALERAGSSSATPGTPWVLYAFARISGSRAYDRLWRLLGDGRFRSMQEAIEGALAVSLDLTSYRSSLHASRVTPPDVFKNFLPQDSLDQAFLAWMLGDQQAFEENLSAVGRTQFAAAMRLRGWEGRRHDSRLSSGAAVVGFGYRLRLGEESLIRPQQPMGPPLTQRGITQVHGVVTFHKGGPNCDALEVHFVNTTYNERTGVWLPLHYAIDGDIDILLRSLAACIPVATPSPLTSR